MRKVWVVLLLVCFTTIMAAPTVTAAADKININTASAEELTDLNKIGPKTAQRIVAYREANGPFKTVEDLVNVKGVGDKILELNKDRLTVGPK